MVHLNYDPELVKLSRQRQKLTPEQAALMLDLPVQVYEAIENGATEASEAQLQKLALLFRVNTSDFQAVPPPPAKKKRKLSKRQQDIRDGDRLKVDKDYISEEELEKARKKMPEITEEGLRFVKFMARLAVDMTLKDFEQEKQLEREPGGFHPERSLPCGLCGERVSGKAAWFDKNGQQCLRCYQGIKDGLIPAGLTKDHDLFYTDLELKLSFLLEKKMVNQLIKQKHIKARVLPGLRLFLLSDNSEFFPPKTVIKSAVVKEILPDGREEFVFPPWYALVDPNEHLKNYGISKVMRWEPTDRTKP